MPGSATRQLRQVRAITSASGLAAKLLLVGAAAALAADVVSPGAITEPTRSATDEDGESGSALGGLDPQQDPLSDAAPVSEVVAEVAREAAEPVTAGIEPIAKAAAPVLEPV